MSVKEKMTAIADPLREISGTSVLMSLDDMAERAQEAVTEAETQTDLIEQISNALIGKAAGDGAVELQSKNAYPSESSQTIRPDPGYDGLSSVQIEGISPAYVGTGVTRKAAQAYTPGTADQTIEAGQYLTGEQTIEGDAALLPSNIRNGITIFGVEGTMSGNEDSKPQAKEVTPSEEEQIVLPDDGYNCLSQVVVGAIPDEYENVTEPLEELNAVNGGTAASTISGAVDNTETLAGEQEGLLIQIADALNGKITGSAPLLQEKSITPSESEQTVRPDIGYDGLSQVSVGAISSTYVGSGVTKKAAQTYTPGTSDQTIAAGQYLSGEQTVRGDADLKAENIRSGAEIFGVSGTYAGEAATLQEKSVTPSKSAQSVTPDGGYDGLSKVNVGAIPDEYIVPTGTAQITENGEHDVRTVQSVIVSVDAPEPVLQEKTATPSKSAQTVTADDGYDGLSSVTVKAIPDEYIIPSGTVTLTANGEHDVRSAEKAIVEVESPVPALQEKTARPMANGQTIRADDGYDGLSAVYITGDADLVASNIRSGIEIFGVGGTYTGEEPVLQSKSVTPTTSEQSVTPDSGYDGLSQVSVGAIPDEYVVPSGTVSITENGTHNVREAESVNVSVDAPEPALQEKTVSPATSQQTVTPDSGYDGLSKVTVSAMPTAAQATPSISVSSEGVITASATQTEGYVSAGTKSATKQLTVQAEKTVTPTTTDQAAVSSGVYTTGAVTVKGDANLLAENIKSGVSIFDVLGTFEGSGGGLPQGISAMEYGTVTPSADTTAQITVEHSLGVTPDFFIWWLDSDFLEDAAVSTALRGGLFYSGVASANYNVSNTTAGYNDSGTFGFSNGTLIAKYYMNEKSLALRCTTSYIVKAGYTYHWVAGVLDTAL